MKGERSLKAYFKEGVLEAGCDEAGRGCLAGPVFAAAVILPPNFSSDLLDDSKKLTARQREMLRPVIQEEALAWAVCMLSNEEIDRINILNASIMSMHGAVRKLTVKPEFLIIDGNRFKPYPDIPHCCIVKGDGKYYSIAAASVLAKTYRDDYMQKLHAEYPMYGWDRNKGYPTAVHRDSIRKYGITSYHRKTFRLLPEQLELPFKNK